MKKNNLLDRVKNMNPETNISRMDTMKQVFPFLIILSFCFMTGCNKCTCTKEKKYQPKGDIEKKYTYLTNEEKEFASKLSDEHYKIFCEEFNTQQRASAMKLLDINACKRSGSCGTIPQHMSPDEAVEQIYRGHRMHITPDE